jgi:hypothetical protein
MVIAHRRAWLISAYGRRKRRRSAEGHRQWDIGVACGSLVERANSA